MTAISPRRRWLAYGLIALALGLTANSVLGPLLVGAIRYRFSETLINQGIGLDAVALLGAVPVAVAAALLTLRGHLAGPVLALIPATFAAYMAPQYVVGPDYLGIAGNNEQFFLFHLGLFVLALGTIVLAWTETDRTRLRPATAGSDRRRSWVMFGVAAFILLGRWLPFLVELTQGDPTSPDYVENPTSFLLIGLLDLGLVVPAALTAGIGLRFHASWSRTAAYAVIGWFALVPAAVAAMAIAMVVNGDPAADTGTAAVFAVAAVVFTAGAAALYRPLFGPGPGDDRDDSEVVARADSGAVVG